MSENRGSEILGAIFTFIVFFVAIGLTAWLLVIIIGALYFGILYLSRKVPYGLPIAGLLLVILSAWGLRYHYVINHQAQYGTLAYDQKDYTAALKHWESGAEHGNVESMFLLGSLYDKGEGVSRIIKPQRIGITRQWTSWITHPGGSRTAPNLQIRSERVIIVSENFMKTVPVLKKISIKHGTFTTIPKHRPR